MSRTTIMATGLGLALASVTAIPMDRASAAQQDFLDDRSTPEALVRSLYNAIDRKEYLRAWSYYGEGEGQPDWNGFADGFADTGTVRLKIGQVRSEGAAGTIYATVPVAIEATDTGGRTMVFTGCYTTRFLQPANQAEPPYRPMQIDKGDLARSDAGFDEAAGSCPDA